jgi:hypothetical protein
MDHRTIDPKTAYVAGTTLVLASALAIAGFTALGSVFSYPQILQEPTADILTLFRLHQAAVMSWFGVLMIGAALMAPAGIWIGRMAGGTLGRGITAVGIAAAVVQVAGLQRWLTLVPAISSDAMDPSRRSGAEHRFELWHTVLGTGVGETGGYTLTALFTVLVVHALRRSLLPSWLAITGLVAAALIATGVAVPLIHGASLTNFAGYILWCSWLLAVAATLFRVRTATPVQAATDPRSGANHHGSNNNSGVRR